MPDAHHVRSAAGPSELIGALAAALGAFDHASPRQLGADLGDVKATDADGGRHGARGVCFTSLAQDEQHPLTDGVMVHRLPISAR